MPSAAPAARPVDPLRVGLSINTLGVDAKIAVHAAPTAPAIQGHVEDRNNGVKGVDFDDKSIKETDRTTLPIVQMARENNEFRKVVMTGEKKQVVLMTIRAGGEIGGETHEGHDQILVFVEGTGKARIGEAQTEVGEGQLSFVPSGVYHNLINDGTAPLNLYTMYNPPEHEPGAEHETKAEADAEEG